MSRRTGTVHHTHKYFKRPDGLWACAGVDGCTHFMPTNMLPAPVGRLSLCWLCEKPFQLTPYNMREAKPVCDDCEEEDLEAVLMKNKEITRPDPPDVLRKYREAIERNRRAQEARRDETRPIAEPDQIEVIGEDE